ncbi:Uma2 family endonuclease [Capnocytophaga leadbetteri]|uniref:Uma2 family endonuclease n=1 Tax=Capnocytophaga leadbetteri TaxID=327575 RepID=UPI0028EA3B94|nr:Uma2 family endonuclease [Capnocytophaga leadbetteri]
MEITNINQLDPLYGVYSYADYLLWKFKERVELFKGKLFKMSAPSAIHQEISMRLAGELYQFFKGKDCKVFHAPFDVRLLKESQEDKNIYTVVQPDICVVCDPEKIDKRGCEGAPDLVIEILSPGNSKKEMKYKYALYEEAKVPEYWIIDPDHQNVLVYVLEDGKYLNPMNIVEGNITSQKFSTLKIHTDDIFSNN